MEFSKNGNMVIIDKDDDEIYDLFINRCEFILNNLSNIDYKKLLKLSFIYINYKYYNCKYNNDIMIELNKLIIV